MADTAKAVDDQTQLLSDLATQWGGVRDLVESFARLLNVREVEFEFTGLRPGEKMNEELEGRVAARTAPTG